MEQLKFIHYHISLSLLLLFNAFCINADVLLDDFKDQYGGRPSQCHLGEAYGLDKWGEDKIDSGNGWWYVYYDSLGTQIASHQGKNITDDGKNIDEIVHNGALHIIFKTYLSSAKQMDSSWAYAGIGCDLMGKSDQYFDFSKLKKISFNYKGIGNIRLQFYTKDMIDSAFDWGFYNFTIRLYESWKDTSVDVKALEPKNFSPAWFLGWTWDHGKNAVNSIEIEATPDEDTSSHDSDEVYIDNIRFIGLDYKETFGFDHIDEIINPMGFNLHENNAGLCISPLGTKAMSISFTLTKSSKVKLSIFDPKGKTVIKLINRKQNKGLHTVVADFKTQPINSGIYFITLNTGCIVASQKFIYVK